MPRAVKAKSAPKATRKASGSEAAPSDDPFPLMRTRSGRTLLPLVNGGRRRRIRRQPPEETAHAQPIDDGRTSTRPARKGRTVDTRAASPKENDAQRKAEEQVSGSKKRQSAYRQREARPSTPVAGPSTRPPTNSSSSPPVASAVPTARVGRPLTRDFNIQAADAYARGEFTDDPRLYGRDTVPPDRQGMGYDVVFYAGEWRHPDAIYRGPGSEDVDLSQLRTSRVAPASPRTGGPRREG
ncbi:hypothetical protein SCP_0803410 [Sparassis crispa]|uniref:Uncharacterized protein n=1 Tax=Sparassis crispa TaxID=139825 RepID=A0A401GUF9_9APHY|nr:hypothetical protein SCP_0803410 [Sparassis crispa]GBE85819.1 hypothetical protein SCP_0803410 [Sparassis crispa]